MGPRSRRTRASVSGQTTSGSRAWVRIYLLFLLLSFSLFFGSVNGNIVLYVVIGVAGFIVLVAAIWIWWCCHKRSQRKKEKLIGDYVKMFDEPPAKKTSSSAWASRREEMRAKYSLFKRDETQESE